jgi:hypothetical protein
VRQIRERKTIMLIVDDEQRLRAGIASLSKRCSYCTKALAAYPLIVSDDARLQVYHAACAAELASEILIDLYTFFRPPAPTSTCSCSTCGMLLPSPWRCEGAVSRSRRDQGGYLRASVLSVYPGELGHGTSDGSKKKPWTTASPASRAYALVPCGSCDY